MPRFLDLNSVPLKDGDLTPYENKEPKSTKYWNKDRYVIFINGMLNDGNAHKESALALSLLQMCRVIGLYNKTDGGGLDFLQCIRDKLGWKGGTLDSNSRKRFAEKYPRKSDAEKAVLEEINDNAATVAAYEVLSELSGPTEIFAHSQGNLILSNALTALSLVKGTAALKDFTVHSYGSPAVFWPDGFTHYNNAYTFDPVGALALADPSFRTSKVGKPSSPEYGWKGFGFVCHGFVNYLEDDATFIVNRYRWGGFRLTASMDEEGLALRLVRMGVNLPRILAILRRLYKVHNSDVDDVIHIYMDELERLEKHRILGEIRRNTELKNLMIKALDEGPTTPGEQKIINFLKTGCRTVRG